MMQSNQLRKQNKPKRPLSGYNLFYRYKRIKIIEATTRLSQSGRSLSKEDETTAITATLQASTGLEGISTDDTILSSSAGVINEFRSYIIRQTMEGKLFPNEKVRSRLHRKVIGMGFVEMGKVMRDLWSNIDEFAKEVFSDLAEVGRVRYRTLLAEHMLHVADYDGSRSVSSSAMSMSEKEQLRSKVMQQVKRMYKPKAATTMSFCSSASVCTSTSYAPEYIDQQTMTIEKYGIPSLITPITSQGTMFAASMFEAYHRATESVLPGASQTNVYQSEPQSFGPESTISVPNEQASTQRCILSSAISVNSNLTGCSSKFSKASYCQEESVSELEDFLEMSVASNELNPDRQSLLNSVNIPAPPLFNAECNASSSDLDTSCHSNVSHNTHSVVSAMGTFKSQADDDEVSTQDFLELISHLDEAIDESNDGKLDNKGRSHSPSLMFGNFFHDV